jgi:hypothetical protein
VKNQHDPGTTSISAGKQLLIPVSIFILTGILFLGPWIGRNWMVFERIIPLGTNFPIELWLGNNMDSLNNLDRAIKQKHPLYNDSEKKLLLASGEPEYADLCFDRFLAFATSRPGAVLNLTARRIFYFWTWNQEKSNLFRPILTAIFLFYCILLLLALLHIGKSFFRNKFQLVLIVFIGSFPLAYYVTHFADYRYRFPLEIVLILAAAAGLAGVIRKDHEP